MANETANVQKNWQIQVFYDGDCPLCIREVKMLKWMDRKDRILATDIAAEDFNPADFEKTMPDFMDKIQGRLPDGQFIEGVEVFRRLYAAVGFWWLVPLSRIPGISHILDLGYRWFAKNRLKLTGRCDKNGCKLPGPDTTAKSPATADQN